MKRSMEKAVYQDRMASARFLTQLRCVVGPFTQVMQRPVFTALSSGVSGVERRGGQRAALQRECLPAEAERSAEGTLSSPLGFCQI